MDFEANFPSSRMIRIPLGLIASKTAVSKAFGEIFVLFKNTDKRRNVSLL